MMDALFISFSGFFVLLENQKVSEKVSKRYRIESKRAESFWSSGFENMNGNSLRLPIRLKK